MDERMVYGCHKCLSIFSPDFLYVGKGHPEGDDLLHCPSCGDEACDLGYAPFVTMRDEGQWFLCDDNNVMGPYASEEEASDDLWSWFGGKPNAKEGRKEGGCQGGQDAQGSSADQARTQ